MKELLFWEAEESLLEADRAYEILTDEEAIAFDEEREELEEATRAELAWFFGTLGGRVPGSGSPLAYARPAALAVDRWLKKLCAYHRGALAMLFTPREWPPALVEHYGARTSLVVRLECALHPADGRKTNAELEKASVERLEAALQKRRKDTRRLLERASTHEELAIGAYLKSRGGRPSVVPQAPAPELALAAPAASPEPVVTAASPGADL